MVNHYAGGPYYELQRTEVVVRAGDVEWSVAGTPQNYLPLRHRQTNRDGVEATLRIVKQPTDWTFADGRTPPATSSTTTSSRTASRSDCMTDRQLPTQRARRSRRGRLDGATRRRVRRRRSTFSLIAGGHSNLTYGAVDAAGDEYVVRRGPLGKAGGGAHDMGREHRVISALAGTAVPVPRAARAVRRRVGQRRIVLRDVACRAAP